MKTFWYKSKFIIKEIIVTIIVCVLLLLTIYFLNTKTDISFLFKIMISLLIVLIIELVNFIFNFNQSKFLCSYKTTAKLIDYTSIYHGEYENTPSYDKYSNLLIIEYMFKNKKYKKTVMTYNYNKKLKIGIKLDICICKYFPKIIYIPND